MIKLVRATGNDKIKNVFLFYEEDILARQLDEKKYDYNLLFKSSISSSI